MPPPAGAARRGLGQQAAFDVESSESAGAAQGPQAGMLPMIAAASAVRGCPGGQAVVLGVWWCSCAAPLRTARVCWQTLLVVAAMFMLLFVGDSGASVALSLSAHRGALRHLSPMRATKHAAIPRRPPPLAATAASHGRRVCARAGQRSKVDALLGLLLALMYLTDYRFACAPPPHPSPGRAALANCHQPPCFVWRSPTKEPPQVGLTQPCSPV